MLKISSVFQKPSDVSFYAANAGKLIFDSLFVKDAGSSSKEYVYKEFSPQGGNVCSKKFCCLEVFF